MITVLEAGTPIWANGFGCVTWVSGKSAGLAILVDGEPKETVATVEAAAFLASNWLSICQDDGRISDGFVV